MTPPSHMNGEEVLEAGKTALEAQLACWSGLRQAFEAKALATSDAQDAMSFASAIETATRGERQAIIDLTLLNKNRSMA